MNLDNSDFVVVIYHQALVHGYMAECGVEDMALNSTDSEWREFIQEYFPSVHKAAVSGDVNELDRLLKDSQEINAINDVYSVHHSPLGVAAAGGHVDCVLCLLSHGAAVDAVNMKGHTPLFSAVYNGHEECCRVLLSHGASVNGHPKNLSTPLHTAVWSRNLDLIELLIENGADMNLCQTISAKGFPDTPLLNTVTFNLKEGFTRMLVNGAHPNLAHRLQICGSVQEVSSVPAFLFHALVQYQWSADNLSLLYECGGCVYQQSPRNSLYVHEIADNVQIKNQLTQLFCSPRPLMSRCRVVVRDLLGRFRLHKISFLPLPESLCLYLSMQTL